MDESKIENVMSELLGEGYRIVRENGELSPMIEWVDWARRSELRRGNDGDLPHGRSAPSDLARRRGVRATESTEACCRGAERVTS